MEKTSTKNLNFRQKTENFWYHYKWHTIIAIFCLMMAIMIVSSFLNKEEPDTLIYYGGPAYFSEDAVGAVENAFEQVMSSDANGDEKKIAQLIVTTVLTDAQQATKVMDAREDGELLYTGDLSAGKSEYNEEILYGLGIICLLDKTHYEESKDRMIGFGSILPEELIPEKVFADGKAVFLKDTAFGRYFEVFDGLPADTVLCIKQRPLHIEKEVYDASVELLGNVLRFDLERPVSKDEAPKK